MAQDYRQTNQSGNFCTNCGRDMKKGRMQVSADWASGILIVATILAFIVGMLWAESEAHGRIEAAIEREERADERIAEANAATTKANERIAEAKEKIADANERIRESNERFGEANAAVKRANERIAEVNELIGNVAQ